MQDHGGGHFPLLLYEPRTPPARGNLSSYLQRIMPVIGWLPSYPWKENSPKDLGGGATLGCILVAQSLAHADLCKVNLINGPYSCILPPIIYSVFGTCVHSSVGTGGLISLLTGEKLASYGDLEQRTHAGGIFTLLVGGMIAAMGIFRLAFLVRFLSRPALSGFITASAMLIIASQLKPMLGMPKGDSGGIFGYVLFNQQRLEDCNLPTLALSSVAFVFLHKVKRLQKLERVRRVKALQLPLKYTCDFKELFILAITAAFCHGGRAAWLGIAVVGAVPSGMPNIQWPLRSRDDIQLAREMLPGAFLVALVTFLSSFAGAKKFAMQGGYQVRALNELLALGFANISGALCGAVPTQVGLSRMGIAYEAGIKSQLGANVYVALVVAAVVELFSSYLHSVPRCVLNAIIVNGASHLMEWEQMSWLLRQSRASGHCRVFVLDLVVWWAACLCTLTLGALTGILTAVAVSLLLLVYQVASPPIVPLGYVARTQRWMSLWAHSEARERAGMICFRVEGPLFYANVESLQEWLAEVELAAGRRGIPLKAVVMSGAAMPLVDTTAIQALRQFVEAYLKRNIYFVIANARGQPARIFTQVLSDLVPVKTFPFTVSECVAFLEQQEDSKLAEEARKQERDKSRMELLEGDPQPLVVMDKMFVETTPAERTKLHLTLSSEELHAEAMSRAASDGCLPIRAVD